MNDLQIILIIIGALIIAAVLLFNWWQERKFNQQVESSFSQLQNDALLNDNASSELASADAVSEFAEDNFSIDTERLKERFEHDSKFTAFSDSSSDNGENALEDIDEAYSKLVARQSHEPHHVPDTYLDDVADEANSSADTKPAQHEEIKAIFNDAFNQINTAPVVQTAPAAAANHLNVEPVAPAKLATVAPPKTAVASDVTKSSLPAMLQSQMDLIAVIYLANETSIANVTASIGGFFEDYDKPIHLHALIQETDWVPLTALAAQPEIANYTTTKITCSLQLADRAGAVTRSVLNRFQLAVETLGLDIDGHVEWQSNGDSLLAASALDAFCIEVDKTMGFHLVHGDHGAFTGTKLRGLSEAQGLVLEADGAFKYYAEADASQANAPSPSVSFVMFNRDNYPFNPEMLRTSVVKAVTFQLDIPHVMHCTEAFNHMVQIARQMEAGLNAVLVDDNNRPLGDMQIEKIRQQLKVIYATMLVRGIVPGSDSARRLFS